MSAAAVASVFFILVLIAVLYYAMQVVPPVRTIGTQKKKASVEVPSAADPLKYKMLEGDYASQFKLLLGYTILPTDASPELEIDEPVARYNRKVRQFDASGNPL